MTNPVNPGNSIEQALNIAYGAAQGQVQPKRNDVWVKTVQAADSDYKNTKTELAHTILQLERAREDIQQLHDQGRIDAFAYRRLTDNLVPNSEAKILSQ